MLYFTTHSPLLGFCKILMKENGQIGEHETDVLTRRPSVVLLANLVFNLVQFHRGRGVGGEAVRGQLEKSAARAQCAVNSIN